MGHSPDQAHAGANVHRARGQLMETCGSARRGGQRRRARSGAGAANLLLIEHRRPAASPVPVAATLLLRPPRGVAAGAAVERDAAHRDVLPVRAVPRWEEASAARTAFGHGTQLIWHQERTYHTLRRYIPPLLHIGQTGGTYRWRYISVRQRCVALAPVHIGPDCYIPPPVT